MTHAPPVDLPVWPRAHDHTLCAVWGRAMSGNPGAPEGERIAALEKAIEAVNEDLHSMWAGMEGARNDHARIRQEISGLRLEVLTQASARPSWAVSVLITFLCSALVGLLVYVASTGGA